MTEKMIKKRQELKDLSIKAEAMAKEEAEKNNNPLLLIGTVNSKLMRYIYNPSGKLDFKSFKKWKEAEHTVKKGEKAILLWGQPLDKNADKKEDVHNLEDTEKENIFFPLAYVFSSEQVRKIKKKEPAIN